MTTATTTDGQKMSVLEYAKAYVNAGLVVLPIPLDGSKFPRLKEWQKRGLPTPRELRDWFAGDRHGIGILCGSPSGGLEVIDFDVDAETEFAAWCELVDAQLPGLRDKLCVIKTPRPGFHVWYRCPGVTIDGNMKLAEAQERDADGNPVADERGKPKIVALIETRGEGGQALVPGCPGACHSSGGIYRHHAGPFLTELPPVASEERELLLDVCRSRDRKPYQSPDPGSSGSNGEKGNRPGDDYGRRVDWADVLVGWECVYKKGDVRYWRRPGKSQFHSATTGYCHGKDNTERLFVFSTNGAPFEPRKTYSKFEAYAVLNHEGNFAEAAAELGRQGYGEQRHHRTSANGQHGSGVSDHPENHDGFPLGNLTLRPGMPRRTPTKITLPLCVLKDGMPIDHADLTSAASGRAAVVKLLAGHLGDQADAKEIGGVLGRVLSAAVAKLESNSSGQLRLADIVRREVPAIWDLTHRTTRGVCSAKRGETTRAEFVEFIPGWLLDQCVIAGDAPAGRSPLRSAVRGELEILWTDLTAALGTVPAREAEATLTARQFEAALRSLWTTPWVEKAVKLGDQWVPVSTTLVSEVKDKTTGPTRWEMILRPHLAWWRIQQMEVEGQVAGEVLVKPFKRLAMRFELCSKARCQLPGVFDKDSLREAGERYGLIDPLTETVERTRDGVPKQTRLAVLALPFSELLLAELDTDIL